MTFGPGNLWICEYCNPHHFRYDNVSFHHTLYMHFPTMLQFCPTFLILVKKVKVDLFKKPLDLFVIGVGRGENENHFCFEINIQFVAEGPNKGPFINQVPGGGLSNGSFSIFFRVFP